MMALTSPIGETSMRKPQRPPDYIRYSCATDSRAVIEPPAPLLSAYTLTVQVAGLLKGPRFRSLPM